MASTSPEDPTIAVAAKTDVPLASAKSAPERAPQQGYKIVRVQKPDGTIVKVRRPIVANNITKPIAATQKTAQAAGIHEASKSVQEASIATASKKDSDTNGPVVLDGNAASPQQVANSNTPPKAAPPLAAKGATPETGVKNRGKSGTVVLEKEIVDEKTIKPPTDPSVGALPLTASSRVTWLVIASIMIVLPAFFIVIGILTAVLNGKPTDGPFGLAMLQLVKVAVSMWPIVFAAIAAQSLKAFATYRVERGVRLMTLEQLINSHSLASAIKQPFFLRKLDIMTIGLLSLWALSPLASQAMQRMTYETTYFSNDSLAVTYLDTIEYNAAFSKPVWVDYFAMSEANATDPAPYTRTSNTTLATDQNNIDLWKTYLLELNYAFAATFFPRNPTADLYTDSWGYPLVPRMDVLESTPDEDGWQSAFVSFNHNVSTSMFGVPMEPFAPIPNIKRETSGTYSGTVTSSYLSLDCSELKPMKLADFNATVSPTLNRGMTETLYMSLSPPSADSDGVVNFASINMDHDTIFGRAEQTYSCAKCGLKQNFVSSRLSCANSSTACMVTSMKRLPRPSNVTTMFDFTGAMMNVFQGNTTSDISLIERWIADPIHVTGASIFSFNLTQNGQKNFTDRLGLLLNSFWDVGFAPEQRPSSYAADYAQLYRARSLYPTTNNKATFNFQGEFSVWGTSWSWLAVLFLCSVILLLTGVAAIFWEMQTVGPDILGFASSVVRNSKHVAVPKGNSTMTGAQRTRMLQDVHVMMQDVRADKDIGKIALGMYSEDAKRLQRGRLYK